MSIPRAHHLLWALALPASLALAACDRGQMVLDVEFAAVSTATATPGPTPYPTPADSPTPTPTATPMGTPGGTPTPTPGPTPTPSPGPALTCGTVMIRDLIISTGDPNGPEIHDRAWAVLDLSNPNGSTINGLGVAPGTYDRVRFTMAKPNGSDPSFPGTGNPAVDGSLHICGVAQGIPFEVFDDVTTNVDRQDPGGVTIGASGPGVLFVDFDSSHWLDGIDLTQATLTAGVAHLDHTDNLQMAMEFKQNFVASIHLANSQHR